MLILVLLQALFCQKTLLCSGDSPKVGDLAAPYQPFSLYVTTNQLQHLTRVKVVTFLYLRIWRDTQASVNFPQKTSWQAKTLFGRRIIDVL